MWTQNDPTFACMEGILFNIFDIPSPFMVSACFFQVFRQKMSFSFFYIMKSTWKQVSERKLLFEIDFIWNSLECLVYKYLNIIVWERISREKKLDVL